jgi:hypothetical protein
LRFENKTIGEKKHVFYLSSISEYHIYSHNCRTLVESGIIKGVRSCLRGPGVA